MAQEKIRKLTHRQKIHLVETLQRWVWGLPSGNRACLHQSTKYTWNHDTLCQHLTAEKDLKRVLPSRVRLQTPWLMHCLVWSTVSFTESLCLVLHRDPYGTRGMVRRVSRSSESTGNTLLLFLLLPTEVGWKNNNSSEQEKFLFWFVETVMKKIHARWYEMNCKTSVKQPDFCLPG